MTRYISREKKKKKKKLLPGSGFFSYLFLFSSLLLIFFYFLGVQKFVKIENVVINTDQETILSEEELIKEVKDYTSTKNIFLSKKEKIINIIKKEEPTTKEVVIEKIFPSKLTINIKSRTPHLVWCKDKDFKNCFYTDEEGVAFKRAREDEDFLIFVNSSNFNLGDSVISKDIIEKLFYLEKELSNINFNVSSFDTTDQKVVEVLIDNSFIVYFSSSNIEREIEGLKALIKKIPEEEIEEVEYIDLKFKDIILLK
jgi:cell division septal protein FtsQ